MAKRDWAPLINTFMSATENNYFKAHRMNNHLESILYSRSADPDILLLYNYYQPIYTAFSNAYANWSVMDGKQLGSTLTFKELLSGMTKKLNSWDAKIQISGIEKGTPDYTKLFPNGRYPFQNGRLIDRVMAVKVLGEALSNYPMLSAVKAEVDTYAQQLKAAQENQGGIKGNVDSSRSELEAQRILMCKGQYYVLGGLMQKYVDQPQEIKTYFLVQQIRNSKQTLFTGRVQANKNHTVAKRTLKPEQTIRLNNVGLTPLQFYFAENNFLAPVGAIITLQSEEDITYTFADFNAPQGKLLVVKNNEPRVDGHFEVTIGRG